MNIAIQYKSVYIPYVFANVTYQAIVAAFREIGDIRKIDLVAKHDKGKHYNAAYVYFSQFHTDTPLYKRFNHAMNFRDARFHLYHDEHRLHYWIVLPNKTAAKMPAYARKPRMSMSDTMVDYDGRREEAYLKAYLETGISIREWESRENKSL